MINTASGHRLDAIELALRFNYTSCTRDVIYMALLNAGVMAMCLKNARVYVCASCHNVITISNLYHILKQSMNPRRPHSGFIREPDTLLAPSSVYGRD